ncbi:MAG: hypothetical protein ACKVX9_08430 [Blastocatellia bacterium]
MVAGRDGEPTLRQEADEFCVLNTRLMVLRNGRTAFEGSGGQLWRETDSYLRDFTAMTIMASTKRG